MIRMISGSVTSRGVNSLIINANGVGYLVFCPPETAANTPLHEPCTLWTHLAVRDNALDLYGFETEEGVRFFELLLTVSGIGPKSALSILTVADPTTLKNAVVAGDTTHLTQVSGIGKKNAEKIILELKGKFDHEDIAPDASTQQDSDTVEALKTLGYSPSEIRSAVRDIPDTIEATNERVKEALRRLGSK